MFRAAILYEDDKVFVDFSPEKFKELLLKYFEQSGDIEITIDLIIKDIKREVSYK